MRRYYDRWKVTGTEKSGDGKERSWTETGLCLETQDPLQLAMARNNHMLKCQKFKVEREPAFHIRDQLEKQTKADQTMLVRNKYGRSEFRDLSNKWQDPEFFW